MRGHNLPHFGGALIDPLISGYLLGNGYRMYLASLMRFTSPDSLSPFGAGGPNPYAYCEDDPVNRVDPSGHMDLDALKSLERVGRGIEESHPEHAPNSVPPETDASIGAANANQNVVPPSPDSRPRSNSTPTWGPRHSDTRARAGTIATANVPEWRREISPPPLHLRRISIQAARELLNAPPPYNIGPAFTYLRQRAWLARGYHATLEIGWDNVPIETGTIRVFAHVHYLWKDGVWKKLPGHAWIPGVKNWEYDTPRAVLDLAPLPPNPGPR